MQTYVALLRGININGRKIVPMSELKSLFIDSGFVDVVTYINSGNVVFRAEKITTTMMRSLIEAELEKRFGFEVKVIVLSLKELTGHLSACPYDRMRMHQGEVIYLSLLSVSPGNKKIRGIQADPNETDEFIVKGKVVYLVVRHGYSRTRYNNAFIENELKVDATTRNINTLMKIAEIGLKLSR